MIEYRIPRVKYVVEGSYCPGRVAPNSNGGATLAREAEERPSRIPRRTFCANHIRLGHRRLLDFAILQRRARGDVALDLGYVSCSWVLLRLARIDQPGTRWIAATYLVEEGCIHNME